MADHTLKAQGMAINLSAPSFLRWAEHYDEAARLFMSTHQEFSPLPFALLSTSIEFSLKAAHLATDIDHDVLKKQGHLLTRSYDALPTPLKILDQNERKALEIAGPLNQQKRFEYVQPIDMLTGFSKFPDLAVLAAISSKMIIAVKAYHATIDVDAAAR